MRVLFVVPGEPSGNSMIFAERQAASLERQGVLTSMFYLRSRTSLPVLAREWRRFRRAESSFRPEVVHAHFGTVTGFFAVLSASAPVVITYRGSDLNPSPSVFWPRAATGRLLSQLAALGASRIVCVSRGLRRRLWWRRDRVAVIPSGVDPALFHPRPRSEARRELGWSDQDRVVLFNAGRSPRVKRLDLAEASVRAAARRVARTRMVVLNGEVPPRAIPTFMNASDCLLMTSDFEGSPTVIQEALATNLPIVSVDVGDIRERLEGVRNVRLAARDPEAIGEALAALLSEPVRTNGERKIAEFSTSEIARKLREIYEDAASGREKAWIVSPS